MFLKNRPHNPSMSWTGCYFTDSLKAKFSSIILFLISLVHSQLNVLAQINYESAYSINILAGFPSDIDGGPTEATFSRNYGITRDSAGNLYTVDSGNNKIRKITASGIVSTYAGSDDPGYVNGSLSQARFSSPVGITIDEQDNLYIGDLGNNRIRKISADGLVSTYAGSGELGSSDGPALTAKLVNIRALTMHDDGTLYFIDSGNNRVRKVTPDGNVVTFAGSGAAGYLDGAANTAKFSTPRGIAVTANHTVYVADSVNNRVRKITSDGQVSTLAGSGAASSIDGVGINASINYPTGLAIDSDGNLFVSEWDGHNIRKITPEGIVTTVAGNSKPGGADGLTTNASFFSPRSLVVAPDDVIYVDDSYNYKVRKITPEGLVTTLVGRVVEAGADGIGDLASFAGPRGMVADSNGNIYVADALNNKIRKITAAGVVTTVAGSLDFGYRDGAGAQALFNAPRDLALDNNGNLIVADGSNYRIRRINLTTYNVDTVAGSGVAGFQDGPAESARFNFPYGVAVGGDGRIYVADTNNRRVRVIDTNGTVSTLAGSSTSGDVDGNSSVARFTSLNAIRIDPQGILYVADAFNHKIKKIDALGNVTTVAGGGSAFSGSNDGLGTAARLNRPSALSIDTYGNVYFVEEGNSRVRRMTPGGLVTTLAGSATYGYSNGVGSAATFRASAGILVAPGGLLYIADTNNNLIRKGIYREGYPQVNQHPVEAWASVGRDAFLSVTVTGQAPVTYQWYFNDLEIPGAISSTYTVVNAQSGSFGNYVVKATNSLGSVSTVALLKQGSVPAITSQSGNISTYRGVSHTLSVTAAGIPALTYQWYRGGQVLALSTSRTLDLTNIQANQGGVYHVVASNSAGSVSSAPIYVTVIGGPANDNFGEPAVLSGLADGVQGVTLGAYSELNEPNHSNLIRPNNSVWYNWTAPVTGSAKFTMTPNFGYDAALAVYTGASLASLNSIGRAYSNSGPATVEFNATQGITYRIAADTLSSGFMSGGYFSLSWAHKRTYSTWLGEYFSAQDILAGIDVGDTNDPDGDGLPNILEYALGLSPKITSSAGSGELLKRGELWIYKYQRQIGLTEASITVESNSALAGVWVSRDQVVVSTQNGLETVEASIPAPSPSVFVRLRVQRIIQP